MPFWASLKLLSSYTLALLVLIFSRSFLLSLLIHLKTYLNRWSVQCFQRDCFMWFLLYLWLGSILLESLKHQTLIQHLQKVSRKLVQHGQHNLYTGRPSSLLHLPYSQSSLVQPESSSAKQEMVSSSKCLVKLIRTQEFQLLVHGFKQSQCALCPIS